jgi:predicted phage terminase large subunit-like protein
MTTVDELQAQEHLAKILTPTRMAKATSMEVMGREYVIHPWIAFIERKILAMLNRPGREVMIISVPPQSGKTTFCGFFLPSWYLGLNPDNLVIFVSYSDDYSASWGVRCRTFMENFGPSLFNVGLNKSQQSQNNWRTDKGFGGMLSAGIGGGITGNPGHFIIIDDVVKNMLEALSPATKKMHINEWDGSISARFQENTKVLITATRWAEDDLSGQLLERANQPGYLEEGGIPITEIKIKAEAEPDEVDLLKMSDEELAEWTDFLGRHRGETLQGQHSPAFFREKKRSVGPYTWSTLYQASPTAQKGSLFPREKWGYFDLADRPRMIATVRVWDLAASEGAGDWSVGVLMGKDREGNFYVLDRQRFQHSGDKVMDFVKQQGKVDGRNVPIRIEEERAGAGKSLIAVYRSEMQGWDVAGVKAEGQKISRFMPYSSYQQAGKILLPNGEWWLEEWITEHKQQMPDGRGPRNYDQIDTAAYGVLELVDYMPIEIADPNGDPDGTGGFAFEFDAEEFMGEYADRLGLPAVEFY